MLWSTELTDDDDNEDLEWGAARWQPEALPLSTLAVEWREPDPDPEEPGLSRPGLWNRNKLVVKTRIRCTVWLIAPQEGKAMQKYTETMRNYGNLQY